MSGPKTTTKQQAVLDYLWEHHEPRYERNHLSRGLVSPRTVTLAELVVALDAAGVSRSHENRAAFLWRMLEAGHLNVTMEFVAGL